MKDFTPIFLLFLLLLSPHCVIVARVHDYETTRLKSTAGAGVGSLLLNESAILNPAPIAFFSNSSIYFQQESFDYNWQEPGQNGHRPIPKLYSTQSEARGVIVADTKSNLRGAVSYQKQQEGPYKRRRISMNLASVVNKKSSLGLLYRNSKDEIHYDLMPNSLPDRYHQLVLGTTHVIDEKLTIGAIIVDPFQAKPQDTRAIIGGQYIFKDILAFMVDVGADYSKDLAKSRLFRGALQLNFFKGLFLRVGLFEDRALDEKGNGFGIAWVGPKLVLETAIKKTQDLGFKENLPDHSNLKMTETSFALSYFF